MEDVMRTELKKTPANLEFFFRPAILNIKWKKVELANGIGPGCREAILAEIKALKNDPKNKTAGV